MKTSLLLTLAFTASLAAARAQEAQIDFSKQVKPILEASCLSCHGTEKPKGKLNLTTRAEAIKGGDNGTSLVPGQPEKSPLHTSMTLSKDDDELMPPEKKGGPLPKEQIEIVRLWIKQGAVWPQEMVLQAVKKVDFVAQIQPILEIHCVACHKEGHVKGDLRLDTKEEAFQTSIVAGRSSKSTLYTSTILPADHDDLMPPTNKGGPLPKEATDLLRDWIDQGAVWPAGLKLVARKAPEGPGGDEAAAVAAIHARIIASPNPMVAQDMKSYTEVIPGTEIGFEMVPIPGGEFMMGSPEGETGRKDDEGPQHKVKIEPFWMGAREVTWNEFEMFMYQTEEKRLRDTKPTGEELDKISDAVARPTQPYVEMSFGMGKDGFPAISMTQHAANKYCQWLSAKTGHFYRLPTEAEWEYAARAGTTTAYSYGDDPSKLGDYARYGKNSEFKYQQVGKKKPNPWGLYDIHGNVAEWTLDQYDPAYYKQFAGKPAESPWNKATKPYPHSVRGGSWEQDDPAALRSGARRFSDESWKQQDPQLPKSIWYHTDAQFLGFRVIRPLKIPSAAEMSNYWTSGVEKE